MVGLWPQSLRAREILRWWREAARLTADMSARLPVGFLVSLSVVGSWPHTLARAHSPALGDDWHMSPRSNFCLYHNNLSPPPLPIPHPQTHPCIYLPLPHWTTRTRVGLTPFSPIPNTRQAGGPRVDAEPTSFAETDESVEEGADDPTIQCQTICKFVRPTAAPTAE